jgi:hypothetical protein
MTRVVVTLTGILALVAGGYQVWVAFQLLHIEPIYAGALGALPGYSRYPGVKHYEAVIHTFVWWPTTEVVLAAAAALALVLGASLVLIRKSTGRGLIIFGCLVVIVHTVIGWLLATWFVRAGASDIASLWFNTPSKRVIVALSFATPAVALAFVLLPATRRWCRGDSAGAPVPADSGIYPGPGD